MPLIYFPPAESANRDGIVGAGGDLSLANLLGAYRKGIFPWPLGENEVLLWFSPDPRGILACEDLHISRSLQKFLKKCPFRIEMNKNFPAVIAGCADLGNRTDKGTWITGELQQAYCDLFNAGYAFSVECYQNDLLVGGVYGVVIGKFFSGESMFYRVDNASKAALVYLMGYVKEHGVGWLDTQMVTPVVKSLGGREIPRAEFLSKLKKAISLPKI